MAAPADDLDAFVRKVQLPSGASVSCAVVDPQGDASGIMVIVLHGFPDTFHSFASLARRLSAAGHRVVVPAMRGYEPNPAQDLASYELSEIAAEVLSCTDVLGAGGDYRLHIVGHDWGSAVAGLCALQRPTQIRSLCQIAVPHNMGRGMVQCPQQFRRSWYMFFFQLPCLPERWVLRMGGLEFLYRKWSGGTMPAALGTTLVQTREALSQPQVISAVLAYYRQSIGGNCIGRALAPIIVFFVWIILSVLTCIPGVGRCMASGIFPPPLPCPELAVHGAEDGCIGVDCFEASIAQPERWCPQGLTKLRVEGAGHWCHLEKPELVEPAILEHIEKEGRAGASAS